MRELTSAPLLITAQKPLYVLSEHKMGPHKSVFVIRKYLGFLVCPIFILAALVAPEETVHGPTSAAEQ